MRCSSYSCDLHVIPAEPLPLGLLVGSGMCGTSTIHALHGIRTDVLLAARGIASCRDARQPNAGGQKMKGKDQATDGRRETSMRAGYYVHVEMPRHGEKKKKTRPLPCTPENVKCDKMGFQSP